MFRDPNSVEQYWIMHELQVPSPSARLQWLRELPVSKAEGEAEGTRLLQGRRGNLVCGQTRLNKM